MKQKEFKKGFKEDLHCLAVVLSKCDNGDLSFGYCVPILYRFISRYLWHVHSEMVFKK